MSLKQRRLPYGVGEGIPTQASPRETTGWNNIAVRIEVWWEQVRPGNEPESFRFRNVDLVAA